jgi:Arc/MetJ family transcription regulator
MDTRTNIVLDDELVAKAMVKAGVSTKKAAIDTALRAYVREPDWQGLLALAGSGVLADDYDPAQLFEGNAAQLVAREPRVAYRALRSAPVKPAAKAAVKPTKPAAAPRRK